MRIFVLCKRVWVCRISLLFSPKKCPARKYLVIALLPSFLILTLLLWLLQFSLGCKLYMCILLHLTASLQSHIFTIRRLSWSMKSPIYSHFAWWSRCHRYFWKASVLTCIPIFTMLHVYCQMTITIEESFQIALKSRFVTLTLASVLVVISQKQRSLSYCCGYSDESFPDQCRQHHNAVCINGFFDKFHLLLRACKDNYCCHVHNFDLDILMYVCTYQETFIHLSCWAWLVCLQLKNHS